MFIYKTNQHKDPLQTIQLDGLNVLEIDEKKAHLKYVFQIYNPRSPDKLFFLQASGDTDYKEWISVVRRACELSKTVKKKREEMEKKKLEDEKRKQEMEMKKEVAAAVEEVSENDVATVLFVINTVAKNFKKGGLLKSGLLNVDIDEQERASKLFKQYRAVNRMDFTDEENNVPMEFLRWLLPFLLCRCVYTI